MSIKDPFVAEIVRIIKERCPRLYGKRTVVLVSMRFHREAFLELNKRNEIFGANLVNNEDSSLFIDRVLVLPVPWLSDYEFEIRPPNCDDCCE